MTMQDHDADEKIPPLRKTTIRSSYLADNFLVLTGIALAGLAAFFPWYAFYNSKNLAHVPGTAIGSRDLPEMAARDVVNPSPSAIPDKDAALNGTNPELIVTGAIPDELLTGTNPEPETKHEEDHEAEAEQPMPIDTSYKLLHVANGEAMIEYGGGIFLARVGEVLPDDSRIATMKKDGDKWVIVTDKGDVIKPEAE